MGKYRGKFQLTVDIKDQNVVEPTPPSCDPPSERRFFGQYVIGVYPVTSVGNPAYFIIHHGCIKHLSYKLIFVIVHEKYLKFC